MKSQKLLFMNITFWLSILIFAACQPNASSDATEDQVSGVTLLDGYSFPYKLRNPDATYAMPKDLEEISGLGMSPDDQTIVAVQDEDGKIFMIDPENGQVKKDIKFWKDGDYEGVEWVEDAIYVVKSSGTIYEVTDLEAEEPKTEKYNFFLDGDNDVEGLAYDKNQQQLLLACKAKAGHENSYKYKKGIYAFDLKRKELLESPAYFISLDSINAFLKKDPNIRKLEKLLEFFNPEEPFGFAPSGLAIHPQTGNLYITSSVGKMLLVLSRDGKIIHIEKLDKDIHRQPEGLCFTRDGKLYIANEGKGGDGKIHFFNQL
jgi:uncharacterized protein YjiK